MSILITGGSGIVGSELARLLVSGRKEVVLFSRNMDTSRISDIINKVKCVKGDIGNSSDISNVIKKYKITEIYHMGAMLTFASEADPQASFQTNVIGTRNILESAISHKVKKVFYSSSIGTFGLEAGNTITDTIIQRPTSIYGIGKLYCEGLGRYYRSRYGLDFRCVRYPAVVGPGVKTPGHWIPPMIEDAIAGKVHNSLVSENTGSWMISLRDAAKAALMIMKAQKKNIKMINYNVTGCVPAIRAKEIATALKKYIPDAAIYFKKKNDKQAHEGHTGRFDDTCARREWKWKPEHETAEKIVKAFIDQMKAFPERYEILP